MVLAEAPAGIRARSRPSSERVCGSRSRVSGCEPCGGCAPCVIKAVGMAGSTIGRSRYSLAMRARAAASRRVRLMRAVHASARALGLDAETRHAVQQRVTGKASLRDMNTAEVSAVLEHLNRQQGPILWWC